MRYITSIVHYLMGNYAAPTIGLTYILIKLFVKHAIHKAIDHAFDLWDVIAWFSVDIVLLALSVCIASNVVKGQGLSGQETYLFYVLFVGSFLVNAVCYLFFTKRRDKLNNVRPYLDRPLTYLLSASWFIGFAWFWAVLDGLKQ